MKILLVLLVLMAPAWADRPLTCRDLNRAYERDDTSAAFVAGYALAAFHSQAKDIEPPTDGIVLDFIFAYCEAYPAQHIQHAANEAYRHFRLVAD